MLTRAFAASPAKLIATNRPRGQPAGVYSATLGEGPSAATTFSCTPMSPSGRARCRRHSVDEGVSIAAAFAGRRSDPIVCFAALHSELLFVESGGTIWRLSSALTSQTTRSMANAVGSSSDSIDIQGSGRAGDFNGDGTTGGFCRMSRTCWISSSSKIRLGAMTDTAAVAPAR